MPVCPCSRTGGKGTKRGMADRSDDATYRAYLEALQTGRRREAFRIVDEARAAGADIQSLYLNVFQPAMREVGRLWQMNRMTVAQEHLATAITQGAMARLYEDIFRRQDVDLTEGRPLLIAACAPQERHEIGLRMLCDLLELDGWDTVFLGATVPGDPLVDMLVERQPQVLALSASTAPQVAELELLIRRLREAVADPPFVLAGGRAFEDDADLAHRIGADGVATDARDAVRLLRHVVDRK